MRSFIMYGSIAAIIAFVSFVAGFAVGHKQGAFQAALQENKIAVGCLKWKPDLNLSPEFREYLKGRIYYNIATRYPNDRGYLFSSDWDFGPVDLDVLPSRIYAKDPYVDSESFTDATKHLSNATKP